MAVDSARAKSLFLAASDLPTVHRAGYLDRECGHDAELRGRVEALLAADASANSGKFDANATNDANAMNDQPETSSYHSPVAGVAGTVIGGKYTLAEPIGEGGMGSVWRAKQTEPVKRFVAVKLIKAGMDSRQVLARFEAERQALAVMDHPNIAKVLDGGLHDRRPFFVMELVKGVPITEYCDAHKLTPPARLELFTQACQAIQHAHQKGIIHRDIKPSNVLVALYDDRPVVKVIDFGVAKATGGTLTEYSIDTGFGVVGTPQYMSPEQATFNNLDIDTRSDVYALGVLLYELLTGSPPFTQKELEKKGLLEMLRVVREEEPPRPSAKLSTANALPSLSASRGTEPKKLTGLLRNELDWIVMKALEKDRTRRYETANGFAADVNRYLNGEAVQAHPPSTAYRLKKFVRRNKGKVFAAGLVFASLLAGVAGTTFGLIRADVRRIEAEHAQANEAEQRAKAVKAADRTREVLDAMVSEATGDSLSTQKEISAEQKKFLQGVLGYYREFAGENADDELSRSRHARAAARVGVIEDRLGRVEESAAAFRIAHESYASLAADFPGKPAYRNGLARSHQSLGIVFERLGKSPEAEKHYRSSLVITEKLIAESADVPAYRYELANCQCSLGGNLFHLGKWAEAEEQYRKSLATQEKFTADFAALPASRSLQCKCYENLGSLFGTIGRRPEGAGLYRKALAIREKLAADFPAVTSYRQSLSFCYNHLGKQLVELDQSAEAEKLLRLNLTIQEKLAADFPSVPSYRNQLGLTHRELGHLHIALVNDAEAAVQYRKALAIYEKLVADYPPVPRYQIETGGSCCNLGNAIRNGGKPAESLEWFDRAIRILKPLHEKAPRDLPPKQYLRNCHENRARAYDKLKKYAAAIEDWDRAIDLSPKKEQPGHRAARATSYLQAGRVAQAFTEVAELMKSSDWNADEWYQFACFYSLASGKIAEKRKEYADRSMELLHQAVKAGYKDVANMKKDTDLDPLRERAEFKKLLAELEKGAEKR